MDILVTTPKNQSKIAAQEAAEVVSAGAGMYFRYLGRNKPNSEPGDKLFYVEHGIITGYCEILRFARFYNKKCSTTGRNWPNGWYAEMDATTWQWIKPIKYTGFQGWRYFKHDIYGPVEVIGGYTMPKPTYHE